MPSNRPRRILQRKSYKDMMESDSEDIDCALSVAGSADHQLEASNMANDQQDLPYSTEVMHLPTASDILETEALIRTQAAEIATIDAEYKAVKLKLDIIGTKRDAMMQGLLKSKAHLARIRTLPQEVLGLVFLFYTDEPSHSPWTLMQVNRTWRATALSTRGIWRKITLTSPAWHKSGASRTKDGRELCGTKEQLDRALRRAGRAPLDILLSVNNPHGKSTYRKYDRVALRQMIGVLASSGKCIQVHHLEIDGSCGHIVGWCDDYTNLSFPELRTLRVASFSTYEFTAKISSTTKRLTKVELMVPSFYQVNSGFGLQNFLKCPSLVSLTLDGRVVHGFDGGGFENLKYALDNAPFLITLELNRMRLQSRNLPFPTFRLPNLNTLILSKGSRPWSFDTPNLTSLSLIGCSTIPPGPPGSNLFPLLASLTIDASSMAWGASDYLKDIVVSPLHTLDLSFSALAPFMGLMAYKKDLNPVVFRLRKTTVPTTILTEVIDGMDRLEELELEDVPIKKSFFDFLASPKTSSSGNPALPLLDRTEMHCPLLSRLRIHLKGGSQAQNKNIKATAKKTVKARVQARIAVDSWLIRAPDDKKWTSLT